MKRILTISLLLVVAGCSTAYQQRAATTGAVVGGAAGAVVGAQSDQALEGAVIGAVLGGLAGAIIAEDSNDRVYASDARYHRRDCGHGNDFFARAHQSRHLEQKISLMRQGIRFCPNNPAAHNDLGVALMLWGDLNGANNHFNLALRFDPDYQPAYYNLRRLKTYHSPRMQHRDLYQEPRRQQMHERRDERQERRYERDDYSRGNASQNEMRGERDKHGQSMQRDQREERRSDTRNQDDDRESERERRYWNENDDR